MPTILSSKKLWGADFSVPYGIQIKTQELFFAVTGAGFRAALLSVRTANAFGALLLFSDNIGDSKAYYYQNDCYNYIIFHKLSLFQGIFSSELLFII